VTVISANQVAVAVRGDTPSESVALGDTKVMMTVRVSWTTANDTFTSFAISNLGTMTSSDVASIRIYDDVGADSVLGATDTFIGSIPFGAGSTWRTTSLSYPVTGSTLNLLVAVAVAPGATTSRTFRGQVPAYEVDLTNADSGPTAAVSTTSVFTIPSSIGPDTQIVINEVQPNPGAAGDVDGDGVDGTVERDEEYVEVFNRGTSNVDLAGWSIRTAQASENMIITTADSVLLRPGWFGIFKTESGTQVSGAGFWIFNESGVYVETHAYSTNNWTTYGGVFNSTNDSAILLNRTGTVVDSMSYATTTADAPFYRFMDGWDTPFKLHGAGTTHSYGKPNGRFTLTATPTVVNQGDQFTITATAKDNEGVTFTTFNATVTIASSKGSISPTTSGSFSSGVRAESVSITGLSATESITVRVVYNTADTGVVTITVVVVPPDTKTVVTKNSDVADSSAPRGTDTAVVLKVRVRGDTTGTGDTLSYFSVENLGNTDTADVMLELWRDENSDSQFTAGVDSKVATLTRGGSTWTASNLSSLAASYLGSGGSAGRNFLVIATVFDTAGLGDTLKLRINALGVKATTFDSGPGSAVTNNGILTVVSANQVTVVKRGDTPSETMPKDDTRVVMTLSIGVTIANDTLTVFGITNLGSMGNSDVASIKLYHDGDADSVLDAAGTDTLIGSIPFASGSTWRNSALSYRFAGTSLPVLLTLQTAAGASGGVSFQGQISVSEAATQNGDTGPTAAVSTTATFSTPTDTAPDTSIVINEILSNPTGTGVRPDHDADSTTGATDEQFVELFNNSDGSVDIGNWDLGDASAGDVAFPAGLVVGPRQFVIVYRGTDSAGYNFYRYASNGRTILESGTVVGTVPSWAAPDTVQLRDASNNPIDSYFFATEVAHRSWQRIYDGADTFAQKSFTSGVNRDPMANYNRPSPNATFQVTANASSITEGDSLNIQVRLLDGDTTLIAAAGITAAISASTGTVIPAITGAFSGGIRNDSITVAAMPASDTSVVTVAFRTTTTGTTAIRVNKLSTITVTIDLEARADESGCTGTLANGIDTYIAVSNAAGTITLTSVKAGSYTLTTKEDHHLRRVMSGIVVSGADSTVTVGVHRAGDANNDNRINIFDGGVVRFRMIAGTGTPADIDGSGAVTSADLSWIRNNFGRVGE
jgi:hypothetical protein